MLTRLKDWRLARQERKRERLERDYGGLSKQEREELQSRNPGFLPESREGAREDLGGRPGT